ncbi:MAG: metallophosphoesterase family protein [Bacteroidota bacterium]
MLIGVISDTHGLIRAEALEAFKGADLIFHGGDIGSAGVLKALEAIAPVIAVRGNCDQDDWSREIPVSRCFEIKERRFLVIHNLKEYKNPTKPLDVVVFGHSHQSKVFVKGKILHLNPGSAGPKRFRLPVTIARITIDNGNLIPEIIELA